MKTVSLTLGAMSEDISIQLAKQGLPVPKGCHFLDADANAISRLYVHGLLTDSETTKARKRLTARVCDALQHLALTPEASPVNGEATPATPERDDKTSPAPARNVEPNEQGDPA